MHSIIYRVRITVTLYHNACLNKCIKRSSSMKYRDV